MWITSAAPLFGPFANFLRLKAIALADVVEHFRQSVGFLRAWTTGCFHAGNRTVWHC